MKKVKLGLTEAARISYLRRNRKQFFLCGFHTNFKKLFDLAH
jgi:hypothetical protein